jgi:hypothetical protein
MSSVVDGLTKRNGTRFVGKVLTNAISADSFVHFINRSEEERYVLIHDGTNLRAYNVITGEQATINVEGTSYASGYPIANTYLDVSAQETTARDTLRATTVADGTFLVNRSVTVASDDTLRSDSLEREALIFVKQGDYEKEYSLDITYNTATPSVSTISLTYTRYGDLGGYDLYRVATGDAATVSQAGAGYIDQDTYICPEIPATIGGKETRRFDNKGEGDLTLKVTTDSASGFGAVSAAVVENPGLSIAVKRVGGAGPSNITVSMDLEEPPGLGLDSYDVTTTVKVFSEKGGESFHSDTIRITEIIAKGSSTSNYQQGTHTIQSNALDGFYDQFPNILAGTNANFALERQGNLLVLTRKTGLGDFKIKPRDGIGGNALGVVYKEVGAITDLPVYAKNGFIVKVRGDVESSADDYYVRFETDDEQDIGTGKWIETVAPDTKLNFKSNSVADTTLPLVITNTAKNEFNISRLLTAPKLVGDADSNPMPSFLGQRIQNSVFFKNRLGFICSNNIILSEAGLGSRNDQGDFEYNFGRTTVTTLLDSDPIDVKVESNRVTNITAAAAVQENLILFADNGQFVLKGEELLTPRTVSVKPITNFEYNNQTDPVSVGSFIYYPFDFGNHTGIREFSLNKDTDVYESNAITEQVPRYIPKDITRLAGSLSENTLAVLSKEDDQTLYIYKYFYSEGRKVLSSWFKWTFNVHIKNFEFMDSTLYMLATDEITDSETYILNMPLNFDGQDEGIATYTLTPAGSTINITSTIATSATDNVTHLDMRSPAIVYQGFVKFPYSFTPGSERPLRENITSISVPTSTAPYYCSDDIVVYNDKGIELSSTATQVGSSTYVTIDDQTIADGTSVWVGYKYDSKYVFSEQIFKGQAGQARTPNAAAKQFIKNLSLYHTRTSDYQVKVTPDKRSQYINTYPETTTGTGSSQDIELKDGFFRAPVFTSSEGVEISLENNGAMPSNFQSAEFETFVHTRSSRYGA